MCYGIVKGDGRFSFEKEEVHVKFKNDLKNLFVPTRKDYATEAVRRHYLETKSIKKCKNHTSAKIKEQLHENLISSVNDTQF